MARDAGETPESVADIANLLGLAVRLRILLSIRSGGELSVGAVAARTGLSVSAASQHLNKLRAGGIVTARRDAQSILNLLAQPVHPLVAMALDVAEGLR